MPWASPADLAGFTLKVGPGDQPIARGESVSFLAKVEPRYKGAALPAATTLILTEEDGNQKRLPMRSSDANEFALSHKVAGSFRYQVEAGTVTSPSYQIEAVTRVELKTDSPTVTITPPQYAQVTLGTQKVAGTVDIQALKHSTVHFEFQFNRVPVDASLEWLTPEIKPDASGSKETEKAEKVPLTWAPDRLSASCTRTALKAGKYRLVLDAEHQIRTEVVGGMLKVDEDMPPSFVRTALKTNLKTVLSYDKLPIELIVKDDIGVARAEVEYRVNGEERPNENIPLEGANCPRAEAKHLFALAARVRPGDRLDYRIKVQDNLPADETFKGPHTIYYPSDRWLTLLVTREGQTLQEKDILAQRNEFKRRLDKIKEELKREQKNLDALERRTYKAGQEARDANAVPEDFAGEMKDLQKFNKQNQNALNRLADDADNRSPALLPLSQLARGVADQEMQQADQALKTAQAKQKQAVQRDDQFKEADKKVAQAIQKLDNLKKANEEAAKERLEHARLDSLADRQKGLAEREAELLKRDPVRDPNVKKEQEQIAREQAEVAEEVARLANQSEKLREELAEARREELRKLAEQAQKIAEEQKNLAQNQANTEKTRAQEQFAELARKQEKLANQARKLAGETQAPARTARTEPLRPEPAQQAADALKEGDPNKAVGLQDQTIRDLERISTALDKAVNLAQDPREAAKQLARLQDDLKNRVNEEIKKDAQQPLAERLKPLQREQQALQQAAERLSVPPQNTEARLARMQAADQAENAARSLDRQDPRRAITQMDQARESLEKLAERLPSGEQRRKEALREVARLRQQQDKLARLTEQAEQQAQTARTPKAQEQAAQKMQEATRKQAEIAEALSKMDAPNQEERLERAQNAQNRALADLLDNRKQDIPATQQQAKRELERLDQALRGVKPADEQARELAQAQRNLANEAAQAGNDPKATPEQMRNLQQRQAQLAQQAQNLQAPEAPLQQREAARAAQQAADAARNQPAAPETQQRMQQAARQLDELARQVSGQESDAARAERLARQQAQQAAEADRNARNQPAQRPSAEATQRQQAIAQEARQTRGGEEARQEKERAMEALNRAQQARTPQQQAQAQQQAADALRDLADKLAGRNNPAEKAAQVAQEQRRLAEEAGKQDPGQQNAEAARQAANRQADLNRQLQRLDPEGKNQAAQQAAQAGEQARRALEQAQNPAQAQQQLQAPPRRPSKRLASWLRPSRNRTR